MSANTFPSDLLAGQVAIVTAAGRGIGQGIALALGRAGASVVVNSWGRETTAATVSAIEAAGGRALGFPGDITAPDVMLAAVDAATSHFGRLDILVNNVGAAPKTSSAPEAGPLGPTAALWDALYGQNLRPVVLMTEAVLPVFKGQGSGKIVNITSIAGRNSLSKRMLEGFVHPSYNAMKAALVSFTQTMAELLGPHNINVNAVAPGIVWTDAWRQNAERAVAMIPEFQGMDPRAWFEGIARGDYPQIFDRTPLRREQTVADIGNAVVFLVSDNALNMTGQTLMVDGGMVKI
ncbi:MAG: SDR family NAD(P)-dependent oxidoreductase [Pseudomonadales bacterium]